MAQARRKDSVIVSFLIPVSLLSEVNAAVAEQQANTLKTPLTGRSEWFIRATKRDLDHRRRSRRKRGRNGKQNGLDQRDGLEPQAEGGGVVSLPLPVDIRQLPPGEGMGQDQGQPANGQSDLGSGVADPVPVRVSDPDWEHAVHAAGVRQADQSPAPGAGPSGDAGTGLHPSLPSGSLVVTTGVCY